MKLYDIQGRRVKTISMNKGTSEIDISVSEFGSGVYFLKANCPVKIDKKVIILE